MFNWESMWQWGADLASWAILISGFFGITYIMHILLKGKKNG